MHGFIAPLGLEDVLRREIKTITKVVGRILLSPAKSSHWAQDIWFDPEIVSFESIKEAARLLKARGDLWFHHSVAMHRRGELIWQELNLKPLQERLEFQGRSLHEKKEKRREPPLGGFALIDQNSMLVATRTASNRPLGAFEFIEDKTNPPSRAYLKLWELFTRLDLAPKEGEVVLDLGASPGGWTWVLRQLGLKVIAIDRSPLNPRLMSDGDVKFIKGDAFKFENLGIDLAALNWIVSDIVAFPEKVYGLVSRLQEVYPDKNLIFTIKFQGELHDAWADKFAALPGSRLIHLYHNKHELTWIRLKHYI